MALYAMKPNGYELPRRGIKFHIPFLLISLVIGVLIVQSYMVYGPNLSILFLAALGAAGIAWHGRSSSRIARTYERHLQELATLSRIGQAITANLSLEALLETIYDQVRTLCDVSSFYIALYDSSSEIISFPFVIEDHQRRTWPDRKMNGGPVETIIRTRQMQVLGETPSGQQTTHLLGAPLVVGDEVIGAIVIQRSGQEHDHNQADCDLLSTIATQAAIAIRNARLLQETRVVTSEMVELVETSRLFAASLDLGSVAQTIVERLASAVSVHSVTLYQWNADQNVLYPLAHVPETTLGLAEHLLSEHHETLHQAIAGRFSPNLQIDNGDGTCQALIIPLVVRDQPVGMLALWQHHEFILTVHESRLVEGIVNQAATALQNAVIYSQTGATLHDRIIELSAIEVLARHMSATLDFKTIIDDVLAAAISSIDATAGGCALIVDPDRWVLVSQLGANRKLNKTTGVGTFLQGVAGRVVRTRQPANVPDTSKDPDYVSLTPGMRSELCVPIVREGQAIGFLNFESSRLNAFDESDVRFITTLAEHAGVAIENARLFAARRRQIETLVSLRTLSLQLLSAPNLQAAASAIVDRAQEITQAEKVALLLWQSNHENQPIQIGAQRYPEVARQIAQTGKPVYSVDVETLSPYRALIMPLDFEAVACIPIQRAGQVIGVLEILFDDARYYTPNEIQALDVLASQSAVAIENMRLYEEVRAGRDRLQTILDSTREGMLMFDHAGRLLKVNPAAEEILGQSLEPFLGRSFVQWVRCIGRDRLQELTGHTLPQLRRYMADMRHDPSQIIRRQFEQARGEETRYIDEIGSVVRDDQGKPAGWMLVWRDITEERQLDMLHEELSNMIVHDLRSPLTAIISSLTMVDDLLLEEHVDRETASDVIRIAQDSAQNMLNLVQSLLDIARLEHSMLALDCESLPLLDSIEYACASMYSLVAGTDITLSAHIPDDLPPVWIDDEKIQRVLLNLLDNALRHTPVNGKIDVEARRHSDENKVLVRVIDTGPGIPPEARTRIFDKFAQLDQQVLRGHKGTGLGLTFCKLAVEAHGGKIWVEEGSEGGAAFCFTLPVAVVTDKRTSAPD